MDRVVLVDRDGVINKLVHSPIHRRYNTTGLGAPLTLQDFCIMEGVSSAIATLRKKEYRIFVVSNQPQVAQNYLSPETLDAMNNIMHDKLAIPPQNVFYCTHDITSTCDCRKPKPGLLVQAAQRHRFRLEDTIMIGDSWKDIAAGKSAGCRKTIYIGRKEDLSELTQKQAIPDAICSDLREAAEML